MYLYLLLYMSLSIFPFFFGITYRYSAIVYYHLCLMFIPVYTDNCFLKEQDSRCGGYQHRQAFNGQLQNMNLYKGALSSAEIEILFKDRCYKVNASTLKPSFYNECKGNRTKTPEQKTFIRGILSGAFVWGALVLDLMQILMHRKSALCV